MAGLDASSALAGANLGVAATNPVSLDALKGQASRDPKAAIKEAAKQFESLFMQQLLKSMREATASTGMLENSGTQLGNEMLDSQYAMKMSGLPGGLADAIARQLERQTGGANGASTVGGQPAGGVAASAGAQTQRASTTASASASATTTLTATQVDFVRSHTGAARAAEAASGIPAAYMLAQAAHESAWGQREVKNADGSSAHNLFGIKATGGWNGAVAEATTTEVSDGQARKVTAKFRAYASDAESFADYARLMKQSPRYAGVVAEAAAAPASAASGAQFASGLQRAGYATDPAYADKLGRVINTTLRVQRAAP